MARYAPMNRASLKTPPKKTVPTPEEAQRQQAWRAVQEFNRLIPTLNSFVRTMTGNKRLRVQAGPVTQTSKTTIFIRPPATLGIKQRHDRLACDERDENRVSMCPACAQEDDIWKKLHHELAHHLGNSLAAPDARGLEAMFDLVDEWHPAGACKHGDEIKNKMRYADEYMSAFGEFHQFLELLTQPIEDARIDAAMLNIKPGLRDQYESFNYRTFELGIEQEDGKTVFWKDAPFNAQLMVGCLLVASNVFIREGWLNQDVREQLRDPQLMEILDRIKHGADVHEGAVDTVAVFRRLHEMGHLQVEKCKPVEEFPSLNNPSDEPGEGKDEDEAPGESGDDNADDAGEQPDGDESDDGSSDDAGDSAGDGTAGDGSSSGAFGDDFENEDDRSSGSDDKDSTDDVPSDDSQVPAGDDDDDEHSDDGRSDPAPGAGEPEGSEGDDQPGSDDPAGDQGSDDDADDASEEGDPTDPGSGAEAGNAGSPGTGDAPVGDGDSDGEPEPEGDGGNEPSEDAEGSDSVPLDGEDGTGSGQELDDAGDEDLQVDDADLDEPEDVWAEEHDAPQLQAARSIKVENPGDAAEVAEIMKNLHGHDDTDVQLAERGEAGEDDDDPYGDEIEYQIAQMNEAIKVALQQAQFFDRSSQEVGGITEIEFPSTQYRWTATRATKLSTLIPSESVLGPALLIGRRVFAENKRSGYERNLKSGRVDGRVLGRRAAVGDARLMKKRHMPAKRDYIVGITIDCSGSNHTGQRMERAKRAVFAKAELLNRLGVKFYITAHTGGLPRWFIDGYSEARENEMHELMMFQVKKVDEPWNDSTRERLAAIRPSMENYDGHTLEYHRKILQARTETDKILIYYTDGAMPAANYDEEVVILEDEIKACKRHDIKLLAVGINTDSPTRYGFDTVQVDSDEDLIKVVEQLERHLFA